MSAISNVSPETSCGYLLSWPPYHLHINFLHKIRWWGWWLSFFCKKTDDIVIIIFHGPRLVFLWFQLGFPLFQVGFSLFRVGFPLFHVRVSRFQVGFHFFHGSMYFFIVPGVILWFHVGFYGCYWLVYIWAERQRREVRRWEHPKRYPFVMYLGSTIQHARPYRR